MTCHTSKNEIVHFFDCIFTVLRSRGIEQVACTQCTWTTTCSVLNSVLKLRAGTVEYNQLTSSSLKDLESDLQAFLDKHEITEKNAAGPNVKASAEAGNKDVTVLISEVVKNQEDDIRDDTVLYKKAETMEETMVLAEEDKPKRWVELTAEIPEICN